MKHNTRQLLILLSVTAALLLTGCASAPAQTTAPTDTGSASVPDSAQRIAQPDKTNTAEQVLPESTWISIPSMEADSELLESIDQKGGVRSETYLFDDTIHCTIARTNTQNFNAAEATDYVAKGAQVSADAITVNDVTDQWYDYPAFVFSYETEQDGTTTLHKEMYLQTAGYDFYIQTSIPTNAKGYTEYEFDKYVRNTIDNWFAEIEVTE